MMKINKKKNIKIYVHKKYKTITKKKIDVLFV